MTNTEELVLIDSAIETFLGDAGATEVTVTTSSGTKTTYKRENMMFLWQRKKELESLTDLEDTSTYPVSAAAFNKA